MSTDPKSTRFYAVAEDGGTRPNRIVSCAGRVCKSCVMLDKEEHGRGGLFSSVGGAWGFRRRIPLEDAHDTPEKAIEAYRTKLCNEMASLETRLAYLRSKLDKPIHSMWTRVTPRSTASKGEEQP